MGLLDRIAERRLQEAAEHGAFDDLPDRGKPIELEELDLLPPELRSAWILLKSGGFLPEDARPPRDPAAIAGMLRLLEAPPSAPPPRRPPAAR